MAASPETQLQITGEIIKGMNVINNSENQVCIRMKITQNPEANTTLGDVLLSNPHVAFKSQNVSYISKQGMNVIITANPQVNMKKGKGLLPYKS